MSEIILKEGTILSFSNVSDQDCKNIFHYLETKDHKDLIKVLEQFQGEIFNDFFEDFETKSEAINYIKGFYE